jgi:hypothetical protein
MMESSFEAARLTPMESIHTRTVVLSLAVVLAAISVAGAEPPVSTLVKPGKDGRLVYRAYSDRGDTIPDFSNCGYGGGGVPIPHIADCVVLGALAGSADDRQRIQEAIDQAGRRPLDAAGFRGAVLLRRGTYRVAGTLKLDTSGVVLRGEGADARGTLLLATGQKPYVVIRVAGRTGAREVPGTRQRITDAYVPVGSHRFAVTDASSYKAGDSILVIRHGNAAWIHEIGMDRIQARPNDPGATRQWSPFDLAFDRIVLNVAGNRLTVDAPITCAIDDRWGGGEVCPADNAGRITRVGVENLQGVSEFDRGQKAREGRAEYFSDESHATYLVEFDNVISAWARSVATTYFAQGVAMIGDGAKWVTVQDASAVDPVSELTGGRRYAFAVDGQLNLIERCRARGARHAFVVGSRVAGPNVFLDCRAEENHASSEPHHRWSVGGLFDNVVAPIAIQDRQYLGSGHGWAGANYVVWNSEGSLVCQQPPTAQNFAIGFVGKQGAGFSDRPAGWWESLGRHVTPRSLYRAQLADRLGSGGGATGRD